MQKKNRDEEKVFSVTMTEEELSLFSEFLEQREYAIRDYMYAIQHPDKKISGVDSKNIESIRKIAPENTLISKRGDVATIHKLSPESVGKLKAQRSARAKELLEARKGVSRLDLSNPTHLKVRNQVYDDAILKARDNARFDAKVITRTDAISKGIPTNEVSNRVINLGSPTAVKSGISRAAGQKLRSGGYSTQRLSRQLQKVPKGIKVI